MMFVLLHNQRQEMAKMAINFNEDNIHVVKVNNSAQNEVRAYLHEINTDAQATSMHDDWTLRCNPTLDDPEYCDWLDDSEDDSDDWADQSMVDYDDYGDYFDEETAEHLMMSPDEIRRQEEVAWSIKRFSELDPEKQSQYMESAMERVGIYD